MPDPQLRLLLVPRTPQLESDQRAALLGAEELLAAREHTLLCAFPTISRVKSSRVEWSGVEWSRVE
eukprot:1069498-Pyramimonas_sp.AAC.2